MPRGAPVCVRNVRSRALVGLGAVECQKRAGLAIAAARSSGRLKYVAFLSRGNVKRMAERPQLASEMTALRLPKRPFFDRTCRKRGHRAQGPRATHRDAALPFFPSIGRARSHRPAGRPCRGCRAGTGVRNAPSAPKPFAPPKSFFSISPAKPVKLQQITTVRKNIP